jgi:hypothetical protein
MAIQPRHDDESDASRSLSLLPDLQMQRLEQARPAKDDELDNQLEPDDPDVFDEEIDELNDGEDDQSTAWQKRPQQ